MDPRFNKIKKLLTAYSLGNFDKKLAVSSKMDEIDAFIAGVNMLGEELKEKTISRNYFNNIYNSVSDMVFVLDKKGNIENVNNVVSDHLHYSFDELYGKQITEIFGKEEPGWFGRVLRNIRASKELSYETNLLTKENHVISVLISASLFREGKNKSDKVLMTAKDISLQKKAQNSILKAIIETEEKERMRFAKDIHDSIGQQLSAIKFYIGASADTVQDEKQKQILLKANNALLDVQAEMRNVCFNIMPKSLEVFGLVKAVKELCTQNKLLENMNIVIKESSDFPKLPVQQEFALFRIIQEFMNNTLKHSKADTIQINFAQKKNTVLITLSDNGVGFNPARIRKRGMGLNNVTSRIRPYNGEVNIVSGRGKGTKYEITIPLENK